MYVKKGGFSSLAPATVGEELGTVAGDGAWSGTGNSAWLSTRNRD